MEKNSHAVIQAVAITPVPGRPQNYTLGNVTITPDGRDATANFQTKRGSFSFHLGVPPKLASFTFIVEKIKVCEGLDFFPDAGGRVELRQAEGVAIQQRGEDLVIEIKGKALESIRGGGRMQFVHVYM